MTLISLVLAVVFAILCIIHMNWARGSQWGLQSALPSDPSGAKLFQPRKIDSLIVGVGLLGIAIFYLIEAQMISYALPSWAMQVVGWIVPSVFLLRALGDFKYVGLFKKIKETRFATMDTRYYTPLCIALSILGFALQLIS